MSSMRRVEWKLMSSTNPGNHYGRLTISFDGRESSFYVKNDEAFNLGAILEAVTRAAYRAAINDVTRHVDSLYPL